MEQVLKFLADPTVQIIGWTLGAIGWIVGIVSGYLQIKGYKEQKENVGGYSQLLEEAARDRKANFTKDQLASMAREMQRLEESIKRDIPKKARRVFFEEQLSKVKEDLANSYLQYEEITSKLSDDGTKLPDQIQRAIEKSIMPSYIANKRESKRLQWLLGLAIFLIVIVNWDFVATIIPLNWSLDPDYSGYPRYPASWLVIYFVLAITISVAMNQFFIGAWIRKLAQSLRLSLDSNDQGKSLIQNIKIQLKIGSNTLILFGLGITLFVSPSMYKLFTEGSATNYSEPIPMPIGNLPQAFLCAIPPAIIMLIFYYFIIVSRKMALESRKKKDTEQVSKTENNSKS